MLRAVKQRMLLKAVTKKNCPVSKLNNKIFGTKWSTEVAVQGWKHESIVE